MTMLPQFTSNNGRQHGTTYMALKKMPRTSVAENEMRFSQYQGSLLGYDVQQSGG